MPSVPITPIPSRRKPLALAVGAALAAAMAAQSAEACTPSGNFLTVTVNTVLDVVDANDGVTSLREAILMTDDNPGCDRIVFDASLNGQSLQWSSDQVGDDFIRVMDDLSIEGPGSDLLTLDLSVDTRSDNGTSSGYPVLNSNGIDLSLSGLTVSGSFNTNNSGNISVRNGSLTLDDVVSRDSTAGSGVRADNLESLTIRNSTISGNQGNLTGGGIEILNAGAVLIEASEISDNVANFWGGGIYVTAASGTPTIEVIDTVISGNHAEAPFDGTGGGGGIFVNADEIDVSLMLSGTTVDGNTTGRHGGGIFFVGASSSLQKLVIEDSVISGNTANLADLRDEGPATTFTGGGIYFRAPSTALTIERSSIRDNLSSSGGGINLEATTGSLDLVITDSTVSGNTADDSSTGAHGGALRIGGTPASGAIFITQSTFSGNNADEGQGGIYFSGIDNLDHVEIRHSTITNNTNIQPGTATGISNGGVTTVLDHTVVAGNGLGDPDLEGTYDVHYSLIGNPGNAAINGSHILIGIDPLALGLGPLIDVPGSPTQVHVPASNSPVVEAGDIDLVAGEGGTPEFDQTGRPRIVNDRIDIGAVEFNPAPPPAVGGGGGGGGSLGGLSLAALLSLVGLRRLSGRRERLNLVRRE